MTNTAPNGEKAMKEQNYYGHKSENEFDAWIPKIRAIAATKSCARMMLKGELDDLTLRQTNDNDPAKMQATEDANNVVFHLLITYIKDRELVKTLNRLYANDDTFVYQGHEAFMHIKKSWKDISIDDRVEERFAEYNEEKGNALTDWPDEKEIEEAFNRMGAKRDLLHGSKREVDDPSFCLDMKGKFSACAEPANRDVRDAWKELVANSEQAEVSKVQRVLTQAADAATKRENKRDATRPGRALRVEKESTSPGEENGKGTVTMEKVEELVERATKKAFAAGVEAGGGRQGGKFRGDKPAWTRSKCNHCGKTHVINKTKEGVELCWDNADQAHLHDWSSMPHSVRDAGKAAVLNALLKKKTAFNANSVTKESSEPEEGKSRRRSAFMVKPSDGDEKVVKTGRGEVIILQFDTAATGAHFFRDARLFPKGVDYSKSGWVTVADGVERRTLGEGTAIFEIMNKGGSWEEVEIEDACLMDSEQWAENLFSFGMARSRGAGITFPKGDGAVLLESANGGEFPVTVVKSKKDGQSFHLRVRPVTTEENALEKWGDKTAFLSELGTVPHTRGISKEMHANQTEQVEIWRSRFGHIADSRMKKVPDCTQGASKLLSKFEAGKTTGTDMTQGIANFPKGGTLVNRVGPDEGEWANDLWEAPCPGVLTGAKYLDFFWHIGSGTVICYALKYKSQHPAILKRFLADANQLLAQRGEGKVLMVTKIQPDVEIVLNSKEVAEILDDRGIALGNSAEYEPWSNPAENACRLVAAIIRSILVESGAPQEYWEVIAGAACKINNRAPKSAPNGVTPLETLGVGVPSVAMLKAIGCQATARIPKAKRANKLDKQGVRSTCWGESTYRVGWIFQALEGPNEGKWFVSSQATFYETTFPMRGEVSGGVRSVGGDTFDDSEDDEEEDEPTDVEKDQNVIELEDSEDEQDDATAPRLGSTVAERLSRVPKQADIMREVVGVLGPEHAQKDHPHANRRGSRRGTSAHLAWHSGMRADIAKVSNALLQMDLDPTGFHECLAGSKSAFSVHGADDKPTCKELPDIPFKPSDIPKFSEEDQKRCEAARDKEWKTLEDNETFGTDMRPIEELKKEGKNVLNMGETMKVKRDETIKDRAYIMGCCQWDDMFDLTYAPVVSMMSFRFFLAIAAVYCTHFLSVDFVSAYTQCKLPPPERVWVKPPRKWLTYNKLGQALARLLMRSLYGLKQSGKNWYDMLSEWLIAYGFEQCFSEPCLYILRVGTYFVILATYVDDVPMGSNNERLLHQVVADMVKDGLKLTCEVGLNDMLGAEIMHTADCLVLHNTKYLKGVFDKFKGEMNKVIANTRYGASFNVPCSPELVKKVRAAREDKDEKDTDANFNKKYQRLIGVLLYACVLCNPDALYAVCLLSQANSCPTAELYDLGIHVMVYLERRGAMGIPFWRRLEHSTVRGLFQPGQDVVRGLFDASWEVVKSTSGWAVFVNGSLVAYGSKKQASIALSSNAAEIMAASIACLDLVQLRALMASWGFKQKDPSILLGDSLGAKCLADNPVTKGLAKHIERRELYVRELTKLGTVRVYHVSTELNIADMFTKALGEDKFVKFRDIIMVRVPEEKIKE